MYVKSLAAYQSEVPADGHPPRSGNNNNQRPSSGRPGGSSRQNAGGLGDNKRTENGEVSPYSPEGTTRTVSGDNQILYIVLSVVAGVVALIIVACAIMCIWKRRQRQRDLGK